jgi:type VI secretion system protein ImpE
MSASELYRSGDLSQAVAAALEVVKSAPTDIGARWQLAELSAVAGDLERADKQVDVVSQQSPEMGTAVAVFRQLIRAEQSRREVFDKGRVPDFLGEPGEVLTETLRALTFLRSGDAAGAAEIAWAVEEKRKKPSGRYGPAAFADVRDLDDLLAPVLEVLTTTGKYYWVAWENIELLEFRPLERIRDLLWRQARLIVRGGPDGVVYIPAIYAGTTPASDPSLRLGRSTDWAEVHPGFVRGLGQRILLIGDDDRPILECEKLEFDDPVPVGAREDA